MSDAGVGNTSWRQLAQTNVNNIYGRINLICTYETEKKFVAEKLTEIIEHASDCLQRLQDEIEMLDPEDTE